MPSWQKFPSPLRSGYGVRRIDTSPIFLGEAVESWAVAYHTTVGEKMCINHTLSQTYHSHSPTQTWQQPNKSSPPPTGASHLQLQHPALFICPFLLGLPEVLMHQLGSHQLQIKHRHLECISRRPLFLNHFWGLLCCKLVFSFSGSQKC